MINSIEKSFKLANVNLSLQTGLIANESLSSVVVKYGDTTILCTINVSKEAKDNDFFPLTVNYVEKYYAAGKIPKGYYKREGRMTQREILTSRVIDRAIRPCFPEDFMAETGVMCTLLSYDGLSETDIPASIGVAAALKISGIPLQEVVVTSRIGYVNGEFILNPTNDQLTQSDMDIVMSSTKDSVLMLEGEFKEVPQEIVLKALEFGLEKASDLIDFINDFAKEIPVKEFKYHKKDNSKLLEEVEENFFQDIKSALYISEKDQRRAAFNLAFAERIYPHFQERIKNGEISKNDISSVVSKIEEKIARNKVLLEGKRLDNRNLDDIRDIFIKNNLLPIVHGSSLFTRGKTQVLSITTLGSEGDEQLSDSLTDPNSSERFSLHYNFNPYSCGEPSSPRAPGRREIGHGRLAYKGLKNLIPSKEEFPYSIRTVAEVTGSDGSTSMATLCSSCLSLISTGVPVKNYVAGIAMGLIKEQDQYLVLTDIMAEEDFLGDMDFKVIATDKGMTAIQMDLKVTGISLKIMGHAFEKASKAIEKILEKMKNSVDNITLNSLTLSKNAPQFVKFKIEEKSIPIVIGKGGSTIKEISKNFGVKISISKEGLVEIFEDGTSSEVEKAKKHIINMLSSQGDHRESREHREPRRNHEKSRHEKSTAEIDNEFFSKENSNFNEDNSAEKKSFHRHHKNNFDRNRRDEQPRFEKRNFKDKKKPFGKPPKKSFFGLLKKIKIF